MLAYEQSIWGMKFLKNYNSGYLHNGDILTPHVIWIYFSFYKLCSWLLFK